MVNNVLKIEYANYQAVSHVLDQSRNNEKEVR